MKLKELINGLDCEVYNDDDKLSIDVAGLKHKSNEVLEGDMFFCLNGSKFNGEDFVDEAVLNGAKVIVSQSKLNLPNMVANVVTNNVRKLMSLISSNYYNNPSKDMKIIMITGTNGKTTSTYMVDSICKSAGLKTGIIGTNGAIINNHIISTNMTTPDPIELQNILAIMRDKGVEVVIMEMSAHALELQKNSGIMSDISVFTNLTQDHLDYFLNMENYGNAKKKLFNKCYSKFAVLNIDDVFTSKIIEGIDIPYCTIGKNQDADFYAYDIKNVDRGQEFKFCHDDSVVDMIINLDGRFNISNALGAIAVAKRLGIPYEKIKTGLLNLKAVPGRFNSFKIGGKKFIVDYAHTPDGLENILNASRQLLKSNGKLISIFGCGGNRDALKRPIMGEISSRLADITILTSDNPRFEDPNLIIEDIRSGIKNCAEHYIEPDRRKAIMLGFKLASDNDVIVVSGKGCEDYIDKCGIKTHYSDSEVIEELGGE